MPGMIEHQRSHSDRHAAESARRCSSRRGSGAGPLAVGRFAVAVFENVAALRQRCCSIVAIVSPEPAGLSLSRRLALAGRVKAANFGCSRPQIAEPSWPPKRGASPVPPGIPVAIAEQVSTAGGGVVGLGLMQQSRPRGCQATKRQWRWKPSPARGRCDARKPASQARP
jgi:hypothetical protein